MAWYGKIHFLFLLDCETPEFGHLFLLLYRAINFIDISNTLAGACTKLFYDASVSSKGERLR
jgi:hypothetical protein